MIGIESNAEQVAKQVAKEMADRQKRLPFFYKKLGQNIVKEMAIESPSFIITGNRRGKVDPAFLTSRTGKLLKSLKGGSDAIREIEVGQGVEVTFGTRARGQNGFGYPFYHEYEAKRKRPFLNPAKDNVEKLLPKIWDETHEEVFK